MDGEGNGLERETCRMGGRSGRANEARFVKLIPE
jgi:hypothetical protein